MKILRIFPRKTNATPDDDLVRIGQSAPDMFDEMFDIDEVQYLGGLHLGYAVG